MPQGRVTTYDLTVGVPVEMDEAISLLDPFDTPLLGTYGADGRSTLAHGTCSQKKIEWMDDTLLAPRGTVAEAIDAGETAWTVATADANKWGVGDVILVDVEYIRVTAVDSTGLILTVTRGYNSSTDTTHGQPPESGHDRLVILRPSFPPSFRYRTVSGYGGVL